MALYVYLHDDWMYSNNILENKAKHQAGHGGILTLGGNFIFGDFQNMGYAGLFLMSFLAATVLPLSSEPLLSY
ncbi:MAG: hypothetical protein HQK54_17110, partial [Oligoflexales bacterium]|nr:hypothetical protein [Oligoflexales bacterium]